MCNAYVKRFKVTEIERFGQVCCIFQQPGATKREGEEVFNLELNRLCKISYIRPNECVIAFIHGCVVLRKGSSRTPYSGKTPEESKYKLNWP
jgi:hypothetical protein